MQADTDNARTELPKQGYFILATSVAARTSPASNSAPECLTWGPQAGFPTKGKKARRIDLTDEMIARRIIELAKAGERNVEVLSDAALNVPAQHNADS